MFPRMLLLGGCVHLLLLLVVIIMIVAGSDATKQQVVEKVVGEGEEKQGESCTTSTRTEDANTMNEYIVCRPPVISSSTKETISYVLLAVSGTLEEGFDLRPNMDFRPNHNQNHNNNDSHDTNIGRVNATFLGKALVRGYKSFLDIKNPTWR
jgi:hypothetical protein